MPAPVPDPLLLVAKWRERAQTLCQKAEALPHGTPYTRAMLDRAECYDRCADELTALLAEMPARVTAVTARCRECGAFADDIEWEYEARP